MSEHDLPAPSLGGDPEEDSDAGWVYPLAMLRQWAEVYAQEPITAADATGNTCVIFRLGAERFAIGLDDLDEVAAIETGAAVAHVSPMVLGLANLRGELLPLLDTAAILGVETEYRLGGDNRTLIVRDRLGRRTGLPVDRVEAVERLDMGLFQLHGAPNGGGGPLRRAGVAEHEGGALSLLNVDDLREGVKDVF
jgi:purine-binding chemotaxis protein CheW